MITPLELIEAFLRKPPTSDGIGLRDARELSADERAFRGKVMTAFGLSSSTSRSMRVTVAASMK